MIILVEGLPGTGKSTFSKKLERYYKAREKNVRLILETDEMNPFRYQAGTSEDTNYDDFAKNIVNAWQEFLKDYNDEGFLIQESMTIQQQVNYPLWIDEGRKSEELVFQIFKKLAHFSPKMIYLYNSDSVASFQQTMKERGEKWIKEKIEPISMSPWAQNRGLKYPQALEEFIQSVKSYTESILESCPFEVIKVNVDSKNWDSIFDEIIERISLKSASRPHTDSILF
jgi:adenylate kinase family enzyme